ncbi:MAG: hypothetical protein R2911_44200 [Caldilineaceae bacterium]
MAVPVLLDAYALPTKGPVKLNVTSSFTINVSAAEAQHQVHKWLIDEVSCNIGADSPTLILSEPPMWRVPAYLSLPPYGRLGQVGVVDVDVESGKLNNPADSLKAIEEAAQKISQRLPLMLPPQPSSEASHTATSMAQLLRLSEADLYPPDNTSD